MTVHQQTILLVLTVGCFLADYFYFIFVLFDEAKGNRPELAKGSSFGQTGGNRLAVIAHNNSSIYTLEFIDHVQHTFQVVPVS